MPTWLWGIPHALLFIAFSITAASVYPGLELRLIENIPFSTQIDPSRESVGLTLILGGGIVASIAVGVQYWLVFRSPVVVAVAAPVLGVAAFFATRASLSTLAISMRYHLRTDFRGGGDSLQGNRGLTSTQKQP